MSVGLCPKCGSMVSYAKIDSIALRITGAEYKGISYLCPSCSAVLSVSLDHLALTADIAKAVAKRLGKG